MAPTGTDTEIAMPDIKFYDQMYQSMKGNSDGYFDMLGVHAAGFAAPPEVSPDETAADKPRYGGERFFAFRHVEDVRKIMEKYGDKDKRVAVLEFGWTTDNRPDSPYYWHGAGAGIDELKQGCYLLGALKYAKENWQPMDRSDEHDLHAGRQVDQKRRAILLVDHRSRLSGSLSASALRDDPELPDQGHRGR